MTTTTSAPVTLVVLGPAHRLTALRSHLPASWTVIRAERAGATVPTGAADIVLLCDPPPGEVAAAARHQPAASVVVALGRSCRAGDATAIVAAFDAGADTCVRSDATSIVAAHLLACQRRRSTGGLRRRDSGQMAVSPG